MNVKVSDTLQDFIGLEKSWNELSSRCSPFTLYSSFDYNLIAWKHLSKPDDRLFVLSLYDGEILNAIAPFCITKQKIYGIPIRRIDFIAAAEGDKPTIIAPFCEDAAWDAICSFLSTKFPSWDVLNIVEQPKDSHLLNRSSWLHTTGLFCQIVPDSTSYYVNLTGNWNCYLASIHSSVKKTWRSRSKKLKELPGGLSVEVISQYNRVAEAIDRFIELERKSWKSQDAIGIQMHASLRFFYDEFTSFMAKKKQANIFFLKVGQNDIAGAITYQYRDVVYARHVAYNSAYARFSPGIHLRTLVLQFYFDKGLREYDMMGMSPTTGRSVHKAEWASGIKETIQLLVFKRNIKLLPVILGKEFKSFWKGCVSKRV